MGGIIRDAEGVNGKSAHVCNFYPDWYCGLRNRRQAGQPKLTFKPVRTGYVRRLYASLQVAKPLNIARRASPKNRQKSG